MNMHSGSTNLTKASPVQNLPPKGFYFNCFAIFSLVPLELGWDEQFAFAL